MEKQHTSLHHVFHYNGVKYAELTDMEHKRIIDEMVNALNKKPYGEQILLYGKNAAFNIINPTPRNTTVEFDSTLPDDLNGKITIVYTGIRYPSPDSLFATGNY